MDVDSGSDTCAHISWSYSYWFAAGLQMLSFLCAFVAGSNIGSRDTEGSSFV